MEVKPSSLTLSVVSDTSFLFLSFGSGLPTGIIGPSILAGAMYGRIIGHFLKYYTALDVRVRYIRFHLLTTLTHPLLVIGHY